MLPCFLTSGQHNIFINCAALIWLYIPKTTQLIPAMVRQNILMYNVKPGLWGKIILPPKKWPTIINSPKLKYVPREMLVKIKNKHFLCHVVEKTTKAQNKFTFSLIRLHSFLKNKKIWMISSSCSDSYFSDSVNLPWQWNKPKRNRLGGCS